MIEGHTFQTAHFTDNERSSVTSLWVDDEGTVRPFNMSAEEDNPNFQELLKYITLDELHENTGNVIKELKRGYELSIMAQAEADGVNIKALKGSQNTTIESIIEWITGDYSDEQVFKIKLRLFEEDRVANSTNRKLKAELRKAKTIKEVLQAFLKF